jgi:hypothetical protein
MTGTRGERGESKVNYLKPVNGVSCDRPEADCTLISAVHTLGFRSLSGGAGIRTPVQRLLGEHSPSAADRRLSGTSLLPAPVPFRS